MLSMGIESGLRDDDVVSISHDLKNPLSIITLDVSMLKEQMPSVSNELDRALTRIEQNVAYINRLVHDLLDLSSIEAANLVMNLEPTELAGLVSEVVERTTSARDRSRVLLDLECPVMVMADPSRLERVVANLLSNALKYSPRGSDVMVRLDVADEVACVSVIDQGPGLAPDEVSVVFDKYRRTRSARGREGTGLGLFVSKKIIEAHAGRIGVDSVFGKGSRFHFELATTRDVW